MGSPNVSKCIKQSKFNCVQFNDQWSDSIVMISFNVYL